jgi:hypothetical protein
VNNEMIDKGISKMNTILLNAAKKAFFVKTVKNKKTHKKRHTQDWFTRECKARQNIFRQYSKDLSANPFDKIKRQRFVKARGAYKKACRKAETAYRHHLTKKLIEIGQNDPKLFWSTINKMNNWGKKKIDPAENISPETWISHFETLLNDKNANPLDIQRGPGTFEPILDSRISIKELRDALGNIKVGKAPGPDEILGEYLKIFGQTFEHILFKLVNSIFSEHIYPSKWAMNFLKPIYKKGNTSDPDNFRGLAIGSAFAKLFSFILLKRLINFIDHKNLLSQNQIGFIKGKGTSDHIFFLQTVIEKVVKKAKRSYTLFLLTLKKHTTQ